MNMRPKIRLSRLRDIGWRFWDPLGLAGVEGTWKNSAAADEYDGYLLTVAAMIRRGESDDIAAKHLIWAEAEHMGLGIGIDAQARAYATIAAIHADDQLWNEG